MPALGLREERHFNLQIVLKGERLQGFVQWGSSCEDDAVWHHMGIDYARIEQVRAWRRFESLVDGNEVCVEANRVEDLLLLSANHFVAKLLDLVPSDLQTVPMGQQLERSESVGVLYRGPWLLRQRLQHLLNHVHVLCLAQVVCRNGIGLGAVDHRIVDEDHVMASLTLPRDVQRRVSAQVRRDLGAQALQSGWGGGWKDVRRCVLVYLPPSPFPSLLFTEL